MAVDSKQIERAIFDAARELDDPQVRVAFLDQACNGNPGLRRRLDELLAIEAQSAEFFRVSAVNLGPGDAAPAPVVKASRVTADRVVLSETANTVIDRYRLLKRLGEGGCGVVYLAEQQAPVRRRVALKIIRLGMDTESVIARFEAERQALAMMDHPNIAHVLDAGATVSGRPYFVMDLVDGVKITDYCNQHNLDTHQRLTLYIQVCQAIQHAHQKGVIHRDIKPSNILVSSREGVPVPKVIDFGIAKATEGRLTDNTLFTAYDQFVGTPAYMSPEQAAMSGLDVDTRSDIYSLGVLLYELLTGQTPFDSKDLVKGGLDALLRTLREREPVTPSTLLTVMGDTKLQLVAEHHHAEPLRLISTMRGDLDWIVMKALEKDRSRRYESAYGLAMDVQRFLDNEPVVARPASRIYRLKKLARRNRATFVAVAAVTLALIAGTGVSTWMFLRERAARMEQERLRLEQARMHKAEEDRKNLSEALILFAQGRWEDANRLVDAVSPTEVTFAYASMFRSLAGWNAGHQRWQMAAAEMAPVTQIADPKLLEKTLDLLRYGPLLVESGDLTGFEGFRRWAVSKYADTQDPVDAERVVKLCLLLPADNKLMEELKPLAALAENSLAQETNKPDPLALAWRTFSLSLMKYREGDCAGALAMCERSFSYKSHNDVTIASVNLVAAMSHHRLGQYDLATGEYDAARTVIENHTFAGDNSVDVVWFDWVFARILLREATALMDKSH